VRVGNGTDMHVVIIGCGFAGLFATRALRTAAVDITLVDRTNHHLFQPLLYQVATAGLAAPAIAEPIRRALARQQNVTVLYGEAQRVDARARQVVLENGDTLAYDRLILAAGATDNYFGHEQWRRHAPSLKTLHDAFEIRRKILLAFEYAERETEPAKRAAWLTFVVIGAGATGVELAGTLAEIARHTLKGEFRHFDPRNTRVVLVEGLDRVLSPYPPDLSERARLQLERLGVTVWVGKRVTDIDADGVDLGGERLVARTVIWCAGVAANPLGATLGVPLDRSGRVIVAPDLTVPGHPEIQVVGDLAALPEHRPPVPGVAPAAKQMGRHAARNLLAELAGAKPSPFRYRDYGQLATIGRSKGVAVFGRVHLSGWLAWITWLTAHIYFLIGFRNRLVVLIDWAWSYWTFERSARVVIEAEGAMPQAADANPSPSAGPRIKDSLSRSGSD
jgi:NADH:ubiquinone reductase (H+-translocating)